MRKMAMKEAASIPPMTVYAHDLPGDGAGPAGDGQRHAAENEGEGGHKDRPEAQFGPFQGRFHQRFAFLVFHLGEFDDEDGVLGRQTDEHDQTDLGVDVVLERLEQQAGKGPGHGDRGAEKDRERQRPAFILGRQDQEDAEEREGEDRHRRNPLLGLLLLERHAAVVEPHLPRHGLG